MPSSIRFASAALVSAAALASVPAAVAQASDADVGLEARVWLDRGDEPVLSRGDGVRVYYRTSSDAYVAILRIDTDGAVHLLAPSAPEGTERARAGTDYRLLFARASRWDVDDDPGVGYWFMIASVEPLDFSGLPYDAARGAWDLSPVGDRVYEDPYAAIDDWVAFLLPSWETTPYTLDFVTYHVEEAHSYPRFLCYDVHGFRSYESWNPYTYACASFRVVVWDDPYYHPPARYAGVRVVYTVPLRDRPRYGVVARRPGESWSPVRRTRAAPSPTRVAYKEPAAARARARPEPVRRAVPAEPRPEGVAPSRRAVPRTASPGSEGRAGGSYAVPRGGRLVRPAPRRTDAAAGSATRAPKTSTRVAKPSVGAGRERASAGPGRGPARPAPRVAPPLTRRGGGSVARPTDRTRRRGAVLGPIGRGRSPSGTVTRSTGASRPPGPGALRRPTTIGSGGGSTPRALPRSPARPSLRPRPTPRASPPARAAPLRRPASRPRPVRPPRRRPGGGL